MSLVNIIVANRPGMAGTVPVVCALSRLCPGRGKIVLMSRNFSSAAQTLTFLALRALCNIDHSSIVVLMAMKSLITAVWTSNLLMNCYASARKLRGTLRAPPHNLNALLSRESACAIALLIGVVAC